MVWTYAGLDRDHIGHKRHEGLMQTPKGEQVLAHVAALAELGGKSTDTIQLYVTNGKVEVNFFGPVATDEEKRTNTLRLVGKHTWDGVAFDAYRPANMDLPVEEGRLADKSDLLSQANKDALAALGRALEWENAPTLSFMRAKPDTLES